MAGTPRDLVSRWGLHLEMMGLSRGRGGRFCCWVSVTGNWEASGARERCKALIRGPSLLGAGGLGRLGTRWKGDRAGDPGLMPG